MSSGGERGARAAGRGRGKLRSLKLGVDEKLIKGGVDSGINVRLILVRLTSWDTVYWYRFSILCLF